VTDPELIERALAGDTDAFGDLVERHRAAVYRAALAALGSPNDADDVAQETFLVAFRKLSAYRGEATFKTWLLTIAWNRALDRRRSVTRWVRMKIEPHPAEPDAPAPWDGIREPRRSQEQALVDSDLAGAVRRLVRKLPVKLRDPLLLAGSGQYSMEEIGRMLGVPTGTVKWRVSEARRLLRLKLSALGYDHG
jgi:RNA polymerase sigma-70 factor (ECF subfamily)